jgi:hypothetical protein
MSFCLLSLYWVSLHLIVILSICWVSLYSLSWRHLLFFVCVIMLTVIMLNVILFIVIILIVVASFVIFLSVVCSQSPRWMSPKGFRWQSCRSTRARVSGPAGRRAGEPTGQRELSSSINTFQQWSIEQGDPMELRLKGVRWTSKSNLSRDGFVKQKIKLSCSFRCDQIHKGYSYESGHALLCCLSPT